MLRQSSAEESDTMNQAASLQNLCHSPVSSTNAFQKSSSSDETEFTTSETDDECSLYSDASDGARRVSFSMKEDHFPVENCFYMSADDRSNLWYHRDELFEMRTKVRKMVFHIKSSKREIISSLERTFDTILTFAESGLEDADAKTFDNGPESSLSKVISSWCIDSMAGEACRGIEKTLIRHKRESASREARFLVVATDWSDDKSMARLYGELSRYAVIYAGSVGKADAAAVATAKETEAEDVVVWRRHRFLPRDHISRAHPTG